MVFLGVLPRVMLMRRPIDQGCSSPARITGATGGGVTGGGIKKRKTSIGGGSSSGSVGGITGGVACPPLDSGSGGGGTSSAGGSMNCVEYGDVNRDLNRDMTRRCPYRGKEVPTPVPPPMVPPPPPQANLAQGPPESEPPKVPRPLNASSPVSAVVAFSVVSPEIKQAIESVKYIAENMRTRNKAKEVHKQAFSLACVLIIYISIKFLIQIRFKISLWRRPNNTVILACSSCLLNRVEWEKASGRWLKVDALK